MKTLFIVLLALPMFLFAQKPIDKMDQIFADNQTKPTILLLGVFHFAGEQVDADGKPNDLRINMRSKDRLKNDDSSYCFQYPLNPKSSFFILELQSLHLSKA